MAIPAPGTAIPLGPASSGSRPWMMNLFTDIVINFNYARKISVKVNGAGPTWDLIVDYDGTNTETVNFATQALARAALLKITTYLDQTLNQLQDFSTLP